MICDQYDDQGQHVCTMLIRLTYKELAHIFEVHFLNWSILFSTTPGRVTVYPVLQGCRMVRKKRSPKSDDFAILSKGHKIEVPSGND